MLVIGLFLNLWHLFSALQSFFFLWSSVLIWICDRKTGREKVLAGHWRFWNTEPVLVSGGCSDSLRRRNSPTDRRYFVSKMVWHRRRVCRPSLLLLLLPWRRDVCSSQRLTGWCVCWQFRKFRLDLKNKRRCSQRYICPSVWRSSRTISTLKNICFHANYSLGKTLRLKCFLWKHDDVLF